MNVSQSDQTAEPRRPTLWVSRNFARFRQFSPAIAAVTLTSQDPFHNLEREGHAPPELTGPS